MDCIPPTQLHCLECPSLTFIRSQPQKKLAGDDGGTEAMRIRCPTHNYLPAYTYYPPPPPVYYAPAYPAYPYYRPYGYYRPYYAPY